MILPINLLLPHGQDMIECSAIGWLTISHCHGLVWKMTFTIDIFVGLLYKFCATIVEILVILSISCPLRLGSDDASQHFRVAQRSTDTSSRFVPATSGAAGATSRFSLPVGRVGQKPAISLTTEIAQTPAVATHMSVECDWARILPSGVRSDSSVIGFHPLPSSIVSLLHVDRLAFLLQDHPQPDIVSYVVSGFVHGFDIGFSGNDSQTRPRNLLSSLRIPGPVTLAISKEVSRGHTSGPFSEPPVEPFHCSPLGAVPKKDGTFRIILDLSLFSQSLGEWCTFYCMCTKT